MKLLASVLWRACITDGKSGAVELEPYLSTWAAYPAGTLAVDISSRD